MDCSRRGSHGSASLVHRLTLHAVCGLLVALYALGMSLPAHAGGGGTLLPPNQPIPESIRWVGTTPTGVDTSASATLTNSAGQRSHHRFNVPLGAARLGALARAGIRRGLPLVGWAMTFRDILNGAGWAIDELTQQVTVKPDPGVPFTGWAACIQYTHSPLVYRCAPTAELLAQGLNGTTDAGGTVRYGGCVAQAPGARCSSSYNISNDFTFAHDVAFSWIPSDSEGVTNVTVVEATPIPDAQVGELIKHSPEVVNAVLVDPQTGAPIMTPELVAALNDLRRSFESANGITPAPDLAPVEDYATSQPSQTAWPEFCGWAKRVCDWMFDLEPEPENPDLPYVEVDPTEMEDFDIGLGQGTCPAPYTTSVLDGEFEIQWDGLCGFVEYLRPLMIGLAWVVAAFIVVNSAKRA